MHARQPLAVHLALVGAGCLLALFAAQSGAPEKNGAPGRESVGVPSPSPTALDQRATPLYVSKDLPLVPLSYVPADLVLVADTFLSAAAARDFADMIDAADADGVPIVAASGYRSYLEQENLHAGYVARFGAGRAAELSAEPGHSEHQTGLAVDIANPSGECALLECFADTPAGTWTAAHAWKYGFIVRYPAGAQVVTGYSYEPWHLRHVGVATAADMRGNNAVTLEEYLALQGDTTNGSRAGAEATD